MERHYSTLELVRFDETTRAPERDYDTTAFELDTGALAPQVVPDGQPQVSYNSLLPEVQGNEESTKELVLRLPSIKIVLKWPLIVTALLVTGAIAVGVAIGVWRHREHSSHESFPASNKSSPNVSITPTAQFILDDTSLAAIYSSDGTRYLFFQDPTGLIRSVVRTDNQWSTKNLNLATGLNAKNCTPLAAIAANYSQDGVVDSQLITLYYVSERNVLNSSSYNSGSWDPGTLSQGNFSTAANTRSLSVAQTRIESINASSTGTLLYYENPNGKVSALSENYVFNRAYDYEIGGESEWVDITSQESRSLPESYRNTPGSTNGGGSKTLDESLDSSVSTLSAPFTCGANSSAIGAIFYSNNATDPQIRSNTYTTGPIAGNFSQINPVLGQSPVRIQDYSSIHQSDIAMFGEGAVIWINYTNPVILQGFGSPPLPDNRFPFARLAWTTSADNAFTYLYHQINGTTLAEEQWSQLLSSWTATEYITISYS